MLGVPPTVAGIGNCSALAERLTILCNPGFTSQCKRLCMCHAAGAAALSLVVATGPFCSKENASYEPLQALLDQCRQNAPDVLVLLGPFVDVNHPQVQDGTLPETFADLFRSQVNDARNAL